MESPHCPGGRLAGQRQRHAPGVPPGAGGPVRGADERWQVATRFGDRLERGTCGAGRQPQVLGGRQIRCADTGSSDRPGRQLPGRFLCVARRDTRPAGGDQDRRPEDKELTQIVREAGRSIRISAGPIQRLHLQR